MSRILLFALVLAAGAQDPSPQWRNYTWGFLKVYPDRVELPQQEALRIQKLHLAHLTSLSDAGELLAAGPILTPGELRGVLIFRTNSVEKTRRMAESDPAVVNQRLVVELHPWMATPGIGEAFAAARRADPKYEVKMLRYQLAVLSKGSSWKTAPDIVDLEDHRRYVRRLGETGKLAASGRFTDSRDGGILVLNASSLDEARLLASADPFVKSGQFTFEILEWMCADGVMPGR